MVSEYCPTGCTFDTDDTYCILSILILKICMCWSQLGAVYSEERFWLTVHVIVSGLDLLWSHWDLRTHEFDPSLRSSRRERCVLEMSSMGQYGTCQTGASIDQITLMEEVEQPHLHYCHWFQIGNLAESKREFRKDINLLLKSISTQ